jgi:2',3'-cyclic-nucleotide 2'-phosphodiesterase (5'-nucleotidase family)
VSNITLGFIGLCGKDFYQKYDIKFDDNININHTINYVKDFHKPDYLIGLTHAELELDYNYIDMYPQIDLVLGGHIHSWDYSEYNGVPIIRTGENAESIFRIDFYQDKSFKINLIDISNLIPHKSIFNIFLEAEKKLEQLNNIILFDLKSSYSNLNSRIKPETFPELICSLISNYLNSDITILNAGIFRNNKIFTNNITFGDLKSILPFEDTIVKIQINIDDLIDGIEYSNLKYKGKGGYIQSDKTIDWIKNEYLSNINFNKYINVTTTKLLLKGVDPNPYFTKYSNSFTAEDGLPIHDIIISYQGMTF